MWYISYTVGKDKDNQPQSEYLRYVSGEMLFTGVEKASRVKIPLVRTRKRRHPKSLTRSSLDANSKRIFIPSALGPTVIHHAGVEDCGPECGVGTAFMGFITKPALLQTNHFKISQTSQFKTSRARALWTN